MNSMDEIFNQVSAGYFGNLMILEVQLPDYSNWIDPPKYSHIALNLEMLFTVYSHSVLD